MRTKSTSIFANQNFENHGKGNFVWISGVHSGWSLKARVFLLVKESEHCANTPVSGVWIEAEFVENIAYVFGHSRG